MTGVGEGWSWGQASEGQPGWRCPEWLGLPGTLDLVITGIAFTGDAM